MFCGDFAHADGRSGSKFSAENYATPKNMRDKKFFRDATLQTFGVNALQRVEYRTCQIV
jgi:hypothetical protein